MANHMAEVAKMLGVELGEEFIVHTQYDRYMEVMIDKDDIHVLNEPDYWEGFNAKICLHNLLNGQYFIKRKPWKSKDGEIYWSVETDGSISKNEFHNHSSHMNYYKLGNCYRTKEEAEADRDKWIAFYASDEVLEV